MVQMIYSISNAFYNDKSQYILVSSFEGKDKSLTYFNGIKQSKGSFC